MTSFLVSAVLFYFWNGLLWSKMLECHKSKILITAVKNQNYLREIIIHLTIKNFRPNEEKIISPSFFIAQPLGSVFKNYF
jgi:hypothetical protein